MHTIEAFHINNRHGWLVGLPLKTFNKPTITVGNSLFYQLKNGFDQTIFELIPSDKFLIQNENGTVSLSDFSNQNIEIVGWLGSSDIPYPELEKIFSDDDKCIEELMSLFDEIYPSQKVLLIVMK